MLKEINTAIDRIISDVGQDRLDKLITEYFRYYLQFGPGYSLKTGKGRFYLADIIHRITRNEAAPFSLYADKILDGFNIVAENSEIVGANRAVLIANHPADGPLRSIWPVLALNKVLAERRDWRGNYENIWLQSAVPETQVYGITALQRQRVKLAKIIENSGCVLTFQEGANNEVSFDKARKHLENDGLLGFYPEGTPSRQLVRAKYKSARFLGKLTEWRVPLIPVGLWPEGDNLHICFGEPINNKNIAGLDFQQQADMLMVEVAKLLPKKRRGVYRKIAKEG